MKKCTQVPHILLTGITAIAFAAISLSVYAAVPDYCGTYWPKIPYGRMPKPELKRPAERADFSAFEKGQVTSGQEGTIVRRANNHKGSSSSPKGTPE